MSVRRSFWFSCKQIQSARGVWNYSSDKILLHLTKVGRPRRSDTQLQSTMTKKKKRQKLKRQDKV